MKSQSRSFLFVLALLLAGFGCGGDGTNVAAPDAVGGGVVTLTATDRNGNAAP